jgi:Zn-dependent protease with chaperone function
MQIRLLILFISLLLLSTARVSYAQGGATPDSLAVVDRSPVPVPETSEKAMDYYNSGNILWVVDTLWGFLIPAIFLFTGFSARIRTWARSLGKSWFWEVGIYFALFSVITFIINLPLAYYEEFARQHAYGLSNQEFGKWMGDSIKSALIGIVVGFLFLWLPYLALKRSPKRWWMYVGIGMIPFFFLTLLISPVWIDPLFNDYGPMKDKALETKILALASKAGIEGSHVFEVNKSVDTKQLNAYVTGFMGTKRIVIWDNTIATMNEKELLFVIGHEMGHYVLGHIWKLIFFLSALVIITLWLANKTALGLINKYKQRFGFDQLSDVASLPLILLLFGFFGFFVINPVTNAFSRALEHDSDQFGLEITQDNHNAATAFVKLQMENLSNPRPGVIFKILRANHPLLGERIDFANEYRPWETGSPLKYGEYFSK